MDKLDIEGLDVLNTSEQKNINGGFPWPVVLAVGLYVLSERDDISRGYNDAANGNAYNY